MYVPSSNRQTTAIIPINTKHLDLDLSSFQPRGPYHPEVRLEVGYALAGEPLGERGALLLGGLHAEKSGQGAPQKMCWSMPRKGTRGKTVVLCRSQGFREVLEARIRIRRHLFPFSLVSFAS